jgi:MFS family permease
MGVVVVACAFAPDFPLALAGFAAVGATSIWFIARANALVLLSAEPGMQGRIMGVWSIALPGMNPVTGLIVGASADAWGPRAAYTGVGVVAALAAVAGWHALRRPDKRTTPALAEPGIPRPSPEDRHQLAKHACCTAPAESPGDG